MSEGRFAFHGAGRPVQVIQGDLGAVAGFGQDPEGLVAVQRGSALAAVVVEGPVERLVVDLADQVLRLAERPFDQLGQVVALVLAEPVQAVLTLGRDGLVGLLVVVLPLSAALAVVLMWFSWCDREMGLVGCA